ncbi:MAG: hypothetical protein ACRCZK_04290 [Oscillospiraceae bacterium]
MIDNSLLEEQTCPSVGYQSVSVCVPVTVNPFAKTGITSTKCCGNAIVQQGVATCGGVKNGSCTFTISQDVCVAIPVEFGATATVGDTFVNCNSASADDICTNCTTIPEATIPEVKIPEVI